MLFCAGRRARSMWSWTFSIPTAKARRSRRSTRPTAPSVDGILFNPAGFLHAGHALRDCLKAIRAPAIEIHMTNIEKRGYGSVTAEAAVGMIAGFGVDSYGLALEAMVARLRQRAEVQ